MYFNLDIPLQMSDNESKLRKLHTAAQNIEPSLVNMSAMQTPEFRRTQTKT